MFQILDFSRLCQRRKRGGMGGGGGGVVVGGSLKDWKTSFEKNCFSAWASALNMGLINKG